MELKIVIQVKDDKAIIGVMAPDSDPQFTTTTGDLKTMLADVERFVGVAEEKWKTAPRNPPIEIPRPAPVPAAASGTLTGGSNPVPPKEGKMNSMF